MEILINILDGAYEAIKQAALTARDRNYGYLAIANGKVLPKGHGRLIDADAFIDGLRDASKRQRYNECRLDEYLTVDDVFQAVIESLENKGLAEGDAPTIIEADKEEQRNDKKRV